MEAETECELMEGDSPVVLDEVKLHQIVASDSLCFVEWTSLISEIEKTYPDNIEKICLAYDSFLSKFPLCYGYWRKYVDHKMRLCTVDKVVDVFERAALSATYCVDMWVDYCNFGRLVFEDPSDVRRLFKRAISFVGKDYLCHLLWDKYIEFEFSLKHWSSLAHIYIQTLGFPTNKLHRYYDNFKKLVEIWKGAMNSHSNSMLDDGASICYDQEDLSCIIKDLLDPTVGSGRLKALQKYMSVGERLFKEAAQLNEKVNFFETRIKRSYFHVKPLDFSQLQNWHDYLDFAESHGDFDWAVKLYERCLIPCAYYPEFWTRYVEFMESKGGREIANFALDRATQILLKRVSVIHLFNARFKEHVGDAINARAAFLQCSTVSDTDFVENVVMRANMEKRLGNLVAASAVYKEALEIATAKKKWHILHDLYIHFSRLKYMITDCEDAAIEILIDGIEHVPCCKLLIEELIKFAIMHKGSRHISMIDSIVASAVSPGPGSSQGLSPQDGEEISRLYLEFVDLCGTVRDVRKAWSRHIKLFPLSVRPTLFHPATGARQWKMAIETREETLLCLPHQPPGDCSSHCLIQSSLQDKKPPSPKNNDTQASHPANDLVLDQKSPLLANHVMLSSQVSDQQSPLLENLSEISEEVKTDLLRSRESCDASGSAYQLVLKVAEPAEENVLEPKLSHDSEILISNEMENTPASLQFLEENDVQKEYDCELELDLKPPSLEGLSLDTQVAKSPGLISPVSHDSEAPQKTSLSDGTVMKTEAPQQNCISNENVSERGQNANADCNISSPVSSQATVSTQTGIVNFSPSSSASNQNIMGQALPQPQKHASSGKNWHQRNNSDRFRRDSKFGFRGHSHKRLHKQRQSSPQRMHPRAEKGSQVPVNQDYPSQCRSSQNSLRPGGQVQSQYLSSNFPNQTASQDWSVHNPQQILPTACQSQLPKQPVVYSQSQMSQYSIQSNEQEANMQNNQAYNQMWQYYYYQQQQQLLWQQQQLLQHQQPQQQQHLQHQYQQQLLQMQYLQQQQQQGQQLHLQQGQELQQLQQQQQGHLQQLLQQQQLLYLQQQQQLQLQPQNQQSQLQLQQQQCYHQQQTQQYSHELEQGQSKQHISTSHIQDGVTQSHNAGESGNSESSASPLPVSTKSMI